MSRENAHQTYSRLLLGTSFVLVVVAVVSLIWLRGQSSGGGDGESARVINEVTIGTFSKALGNTPYHVAKYFERFEAHPSLSAVNVRHVEFNDRPSIAQAFDSGDLQVLFSAEIPAILCFAQGNEIRIVEVSAIANQEIVVPVNSPLKTVADLRGQKLAVLPGTSSHYCLVKVLRDNDMKMENLEVSLISPGEAKIAFEAGQLPAWAVWAPWVEQQEVAGIGMPIPDSKAGIASVMTMSTMLLRESPEIAIAILEILQEAKIWLLSNTEKAQEIAAEELELDLAVVQQAWPKFEWDVRLSSTLLPDFQDKAQFLSDTGQTRNDRLVDVDDIVELDIEKY